MSATAEAEVPGTPRKKHRHDLGQEDHGPKVAAQTTRGIQILLGFFIALSLGLVVYVLVDGVRAPERALQLDRTP
ncbi:MAG TPA: hypothetical protein VGM90_22725 [Kofleriaceae bacterium]|jgi:hypothetical protein